MKNVRRDILAALAGSAFLAEAASMVSSSLFPGLEQTLQRVAVLLLFASMAFVIDTVARKADLLDELCTNQQKAVGEASKLAGKIDELTEVANQLKTSEYAARYGSVGASLASLLVGGGRNVQSYAAARAIQPLALDLLPRLAHDISRADASNITINGYSLIDKFTYEIMTAIPNGGAWLGVTHLAAEDAWKRETATPDFYNWDKTFRERARRKDISVFRLYCYEDRDRYELMRDEIEEARRDGIVIKVFLPSGDFIPSDMSLLWIPTRQIASAAAVDPRDPITALNNSSDVTPLCALEFRTRGGKYLDQTTILAQNDPHYDSLSFEFTRAWKEAQDQL
jgi:hypothetical protein